MTRRVRALLQTVSIAFTPFLDLRQATAEAGRIETGDDLDGPPYCSMPHAVPVRPCLGDPMRARMRLLSVLAVSISSSLLSPVLYAADVSGSHDLDLVPRVLNAEIVDY